LTTVDYKIQRPLLHIFWSCEAIFLHIFTCERKENSDAITEGLAYATQNEISSVRKPTLPKRLARSFQETSVFSIIIIFVLSRSNHLATMTISQPPLSPNSAVDGIPASPVQKSSSFRPIETPASPGSTFTPYYAPQAFSPPVSPASHHSTASSTVQPWSPATTASWTSPHHQASNPPQEPLRRYHEDDERVQDLFIERSIDERHRLIGAKNRSLALLETYAASSGSDHQDSAKAEEVFDGKKEESEPEETWSYQRGEDHKDGNVQRGFLDRSITEEVRLHDAKQRSLALLQTYAESVPRTGSEADQSYRQKLKSIPREDEIYDNQKTRRRKEMHNKASSTIKKKSEATEKVQDPETEEWRSMKTQIDIDRERAAEKKALLLLDIMAMF